jgi:hypothetical protein
MKWTRWLWAGLGLLLCVPAAAGQFLGPPVVVREFGGGFTYHRRNFSLSVNFGRYYVSPPLVTAPYFYVPSPLVYGYPPAGFTQVTIYNPPPIVVVPYPVLPLYDRGRLWDDEGPPLPQGERLPPVPPHRRIPLPNERPAQPPQQAQKPPPPPPPPIKPPPRLGPDPNPAREVQRQLDLGRQAFASQDYGRAAERFRQATLVAPREAEGYFLLGQAHFALGNYRRAFEAIQKGLDLRKDWPTSGFRPIELHGEHVADLEEQLALLEQTWTANPHDPVLTFLLAYQLWFDGRREEARHLLEEVERSLPDRSVVEAFLQALPGGSGF